MVAIELWRRKVVSILNSYASHYESHLMQARSLRAWRAMLFVAKAYSLSFTSGWTGPWRLLTWLAAAPFRGLGPLSDYEPTFPDASALAELSREGESLAGHNERSRKADLPVSRHAASGPDVVVFPVFEYDFRFQRPQHLARELARAGSNVWWISPTRRPRPGLEYETIALDDGVTELRLAVEFPRIYQSHLDTSTETRAAQLLAEFLFEQQSVACVALVQFAFWERLALGLRPDHCQAVIYDLMDDWDHFPEVDEAVRGAHRRLREKADKVVVSSGDLRGKCQVAGVEPVLIRNAGEFQHFAHPPSERPSRVPAGRPVVGYFGAIADWFDADLVCACADLRPDYDFVLVGGLQLEAQLLHPAREILERRANIHLLGHQSYDSLPAYLAAFDVCMIPFLTNQVTQATDPVKIYEYLAQGKPTVVTDMPELKRLGDLISFANTAGEFVERIDEALANDQPDLVARRIAFSNENSWEARAIKLKETIRQCFPLTSIIVVTHNSGDFLAACLRSVLSNTRYPNLEVLIVDNNSQDQSVAIARRFEEKDYRVQVIALPTNSGFSPANNLGVSKSRGEYVVLLNADTIVPPGWLARLMRHVASDKTLGLLTPVTNHAGNEVVINCGYADESGFYDFAGLRALDRRMIERPIGTVPLFAALIPRRVWRDVGELDEQFEVGMFEDDDYSRRVWQAGFRCACAEDVVVHHFGGGSFTKLPDEAYLSIFHANLQRFERKWKTHWTPHRLRPGLGPANRRYTVPEFVSAAGDEKAHDDSRQDGADGQPPH